MKYEQYKMDHQEPNWDKKHNALIDALNSDWGGVNLQLLDKQTEGILFVNGAKGDGWYRYVQLKNGKLVELRIKVTNIAIEAWHPTEVVKVPDIIKQDDSNLPSQAGVNWLNFVSNTVSVNSTQSLSADQSVEGHFTYFKSE